MMKNRLNGNLLFVAACIVLVACASQTHVHQIKKSHDLVTDIKLYEICKSDLQKEDFEITKCGMYVQSALSSYKTSEYIIVSFSVHDDEDESLNKFAKFISDCNGKNFSLKKIAGDYVDHVNNYKNNIDPNSFNAGNYFWYYFLSCGDINKIKL